MQQGNVNYVARVSTHTPTHTHYYFKAVARFESADYKRSLQSRAEECCRAQMFSSCVAQLWQKDKMSLSQ